MARGHLEDIPSIAVVDHRIDDRPLLAKRGPEGIVAVVRCVPCDAVAAARTSSAVLGRCRGAVGGERGGLFEHR
jgi:hypothetical protein